MNEKSIQRSFLPSVANGDRHPFYMDVRVAVSTGGQDPRLGAAGVAIVDIPDTIETAVAYKTVRLTRPSDRVTQSEMQVGPAYIYPDYAPSYAD